MNYHTITYPDQNNGDGLRVVLWLSGCSHHCYNCQNPQTWDANSGIPFDESAKKELFRELDKDYISGLTLTGGDPLFESNLDGVLDLVTEINKRYNFQKVDSANPCKMGVSEDKNSDKIRLLSSHKNIWLYTGYKLIIDYSESKRQRKTVFTLLPYANTNVVNDINEYRRLCENDDKRRMIAESVDFIVDGRYIDSQRDISLKWRGSTNQRVISVQESLKQGKVITLV